MKNCYVIIEHGGIHGVLGLDVKTQAEAAQAIAWQRRGGFTQFMTICTYDADRREFVDAEGNGYIPTNSSFTAQAWAEFVSKVDPSLAEEGVEFGSPRPTGPQS